MAGGSLAGLLTCLSAQTGHFNDAHKLIGLFILILSFVQGFLGYLADKARVPLPLYLSPPLYLSVFLLLSVAPSQDCDMHAQMFKPDRKRAPVFPDMIHWFVGYTTVILGLINIFLGMTLICVDRVTVVRPPAPHV